MPPPAHAGHARVLGLVGLASLVLLVLLHGLASMLADVPLVLTVVAALGALWLPLAALVLAEPARVRRDAQWTAVAVLAAVGSLAALAGWLPYPPTHPASTLVRAASFAGVAGLALAAERLAHAQGRRVPTWSYALLALYALALLGQAAAVAVPLRSLDAVFARNLLYAPIPLLPLGFLLLATRRDGGAWRTAGIAAALVGLLLAAGVMALLLALDGLRPFEGIWSLAFSTYALGTAGLRAGPLLIAIGAALAPPPAEAPATDAPATA